VLTLLVTLLHFVSFRLRFGVDEAEGILSDVPRCTISMQLSRLWNCVTAVLNPLFRRSARDEYRETHIKHFVHVCLVVWITFDDPSGATKSNDSAILCIPRGL
jgi:hypothetical protein